MYHPAAPLNLQVTFNKSNVLAPSVINTTFFNQSGQFNASALLEVRALLKVRLGMGPRYRLLCCAPAYQLAWVKSKRIST